MRAVTDDLLAYSRVGARAKPFEHVDVNMVLDQTVVDLKAPLEESGGR